MATFSQTLAEPRGSAAPVAPVQDNSAASALGGLGDILGVVGGQIQKQRAEEKKQAIGQAIGSATTSILDLENERNALLLEEQGLEREAQLLHQDGITPDEQEDLKRIEAAREKLLQARQSGLLNPLQFQTRMNAMQKAALADAANLAIQPQINAIFNQGRTQLRNPTPAIDDTMVDYMNGKFGVNGWTGIDLGEQRGRLQFIADARRDAEQNLQSQSGKAALNAQAMYEDALSQLRTSLRNKGAIDDTDLDMYRASINSITTDILTTINTSVVANRANGIEIDANLVKQLREETQQQQKMYMDMLAKGQEFGDDTRLAQRLTAYDTTVKKINSLKSPSLANIASSIGGNGSNGDVMAFANIVNMPNSSLEAIVSNLPPALQAVTTVDSIKEEAARRFAMMINGVDFTDVPGNPSLTKYVAGIGLQQAETPTAVSGMLSAFVDMEYTEVRGVLTALNSPKISNNLKGLNSKQGRNELKRLNSIASQAITELSSQLPANGSISVQDGEVVYTSPTPSGRSGRAVGGVDAYLASSIEQFNLMLKTYKDVLNAEDLLRTLESRLAVEEEKTAPTRTGRTD
jgi:hypothetical protein